MPDPIILDPIDNGESAQIPEPKTREEYYLAKMAGCTDIIEDPDMQPFEVFNGKLILDTNDDPGPLIPGPDDPGDAEVA